MTVEFLLEKSKDNFNVLKLSNKERQVYIGSKYNMKNYLEKFINDIELIAKEDSVFLILGIGGGEELKWLKNRYPKSKIIILEPIQELISYAYKNNIIKFTESDNVYVRFIDNKPKTTFVLKKLLQEYEIKKIVFKCLYNYDKIFKKQLWEITDIVKTSLIDKIIDINTNIYFARRWFDTMISNLEYMIKSSTVNKFKNSMKDIPAIVVSAGPSLEKNINQLHNGENNMLILSGGRTLRTLTDKNITPDLLGVIDAGEASYDLVRGYIESTKVPLLFYEGTNEEVVKNHKSEKMFFTKSAFIEECFENDDINLVMGGSIAHILTTFSIYAGCNPIIFIGQDFAYTNEKCHADIAINQFASKEENKAKDENSLYVKDIKGNMVRTNVVLDSFRRDMELIIKQYPEITFINATEGGANIEGTINMSLSDAIKKYKLNSKVELNINNRVNEDIKNKFLNILTEAFESSNVIKNQCQTGIDIVNKLSKHVSLKNNYKINKSLEKLKHVDDNIKSNYKSLEILYTLLYPVSFTIISQYEVENDKEIIEKSKFLYESLLENVEYAIIKIQESINNIKNMEMKNAKARGGK
ncbi:motility associated factor glycosyltransferase family protein [Clostridium botulinum]|uniref:motility associated factor glycosyltransferase family protein n=1 Tax=Clostridium botulinum TaxID=1491 RepID=UPI00052D8B72|nr:6-hydroxymethylpterin diphosphokinase MptE-like protein [Clostridium botulinum]KGM93168.1 hypothetical protein Z956_12625 [Clostridium botulinum D str. CCUG 7971]KOC48470.1 hypothetical protein ADU88_07635 [Clostridium botulinum]NFO98726.1 motility associated factor glycosyltransferase family protein [Clostridium botulinum]OOV50633.1 hypothetical protein B1A66_13610 [Clostridium botulinum D/C]OOV55959.1 hypothetical protein B0673_07065 [Clostridium botulinum D/C]